MKVPCLLLAITMAVPVLAQERKPSPACAPFLEGTVRSTDPRRDNKKTACANEIAVNAANNYSIAIKVYAAGQEGLRKRQETLRKESRKTLGSSPLNDIAIEAIVDTFTELGEIDVLEASLKAEFGNPCERFDGWSGTEFIDNISRVACFLAMDAKRFPKERERLESYAKSLVAAGKIPSANRIGEDTEHTDAAIRYAFGYEEISPARSKPSRTSKRRSVPTKTDTESETNGAGSSPPAPSTRPALPPSSPEPSSPPRADAQPEAKPEKSGLLAKIWRWLAGDPQTGTFGRVVNGVMLLVKLVLAVLALGLMIGPLYRVGTWLLKSYLDLLNWMFKLTLKDNNPMRVLISRWRDRLQDRLAPASPSGAPHAAPAPSEPPPPQHAL